MCIKLLLLFYTEHKQGFGRIKNTWGLFIHLAADCFRLMIGGE